MTIKIFLRIAIMLGLGISACTGAVCATSDSLYHPNTVQSLLELSRLAKRSLFVRLHEECDTTTGGLKILNMNMKSIKGQTGSGLLAVKSAFSLYRNAAVGSVDGKFIEVDVGNPWRGPLTHRLQKFTISLDQRYNPDFAIQQAMYNERDYLTTMHAKPVFYMSGIGVVPRSPNTSLPASEYQTLGHLGTAIAEHFNGVLLYRECEMRERRSIDMVFLRSE